MADAAPQLKRKGEEVALQRQSKKQRKSEAAALRDVRNGVETTTRSSKATPKPNNTPTPKKHAKTTPKSIGVKDDATAGTPTISRKGKKRATGPAEEGVDTAATQTPNAIVSGEVEGENEAAHGDAPIAPDLLKALKKAKPEKEQKKNAIMMGSVEDADGLPMDIEVQDTPGLSKRELKKKEKKERKDKKRTERVEKKGKNSETWTTSSPQGGWFLNSDPVFSPDEKYLILANLKYLRVYATESSLLVNTLHVSDSGVLTAYALSSVKPNQVYIADSTGSIKLWDWTTGKEIRRWDIGATVVNIAVITRPDSDEDFLFCHETGNSHAVNVYALLPKSRVEVKQVLLTKSAIRSMQVLLQGKYVILASAESITIGKRIKISKTALEEFGYVWREIRFSKRITTFNAYFREPQASKGKKAVQDQRDVLDIAVGEDTGVILLFEDVLASFAAIESSQKSKSDKPDSAESLRPKRLHWHRDAVGSIKWSLDGNYIVSGGDETVLTIWQLATGLPQHLPHLSAAIENITVSPSGSAYALSLANNSIIVLSTTELEAKTNIVGIQSRRVDREQLPKDLKSGKAYLEIFNSVPLAVNPMTPDEVLFAVPSSQPRQKKGSVLPEPYLQTFDTANQRAKTRQALTRNNATEPNMAPDGGRIAEPSVTQMQVSHNGEWLATVDEWIPSRSDTAFLNQGIPEFNEQERLQRREVFLKIWQRDKDNAQWKLEARIDAPHFFEDVCGNGRVFDLVADPTAPGFATVGEDHVVRIWRPKTRLRDGVIVRGAQQEGLITWSLDGAIELSDKLDTTEASQQSSPPRTSRLAFSADGSVLAASISWISDEDAGVTYLIDTQTATIRRSLTEIDVTALSGLAFVGQCLVVVADAITVWDMVSDQLAYSVPIDTVGVGRLERIPLVRLATNETDGTFAVALPRFEKSDSPTSIIKKASSKLSVFSPTHHNSLWSSTTPGILLALESRKGERGYITLDSLSCITTVSPGAKQLQLPTPPPEGKDELARITGSADADDDDEEEEEESGRPLANLLLSGDLTQDIERDEHVFNMQDLQNVLNSGSVPPPPQALFSNVLALVGGKSQKAAV